MKYWLVIHDAKSYHQHPEWIGKAGDRIPVEFKRLQVGDGIVYYCTGDAAIAGTFKVKRRPRRIDDDEHWQGPYTVAEIRPVALPRGRRLVPIRPMLAALPHALSLFPDRVVRGVRLKGRTLLPLTKRDFDLVSRYLRQYQPPEVEYFRGPQNDAGLGEPGDFGVMNYAPTSEQGVVAIFVYYMEQLGFEKLEFIRAGFPDACAIKCTGQTYERKFIEFEYRASGFRQHVDNPKHRDVRCDYVVCWEDDYFGCPVEVVELRSEMPRLRAGPGVHADGTHR